jgi:MutS-like protein
MKTLLMHSDRNFDWQRDLPAQSADLIQDLGLQVLFNEMAGGDEFLLQVAQRGVLWSLSDPEAIVYRQQALSDCFEHAGIVRAIYDVTVETLVERRKIWGWFGQMPELNLRYAVQVMELLMRMLKRLRQTALESGSLFHSPAFRRFFAMLLEELDDEYFELVNQHLRRLQFKRGVLISAGLGKGNAGVEIVLRHPLTEKQHWSELILGPLDGRLKFDVHPRDEGGHQALEELRARGINLVADALTQATEHVLGFISQLRAELAFYVGCLSLRAALQGKGLATCLPQPMPASEQSLFARGLYDAALALVAKGDLVSNNLSARGKSLVVITGANQGGKSTFLRSIGLAQLLMQAGMFVPATEYSATVASGVFTHFKREEDGTMTRGKLDEELNRMSRIVDQIRRRPPLQRVLRIDE